jgi:H/ACA ribonucleoprotein complex subunit 3
MKHIKYCSKCKVYSMQDTCPKCSGETVLPKPPKFSLNDKYASYRRESKKKELEEKGLL